MRMINLGLIGWGNIAQYYNYAIGRIDGLKLNSVIEISQAKKDFVEKTGTKFYSIEEWEKFINSVDAVIIATPPFLHPYYTLKALNSGKDVLCEKPMATNIDDALEMVKEAKLHKRVMMIASHSAYNPKLQELIQSKNRYRPIRKVYVEFLEDVLRYTQDDWLFNRSKSGGGCIIDSGINAFDCLRKVLGEIKIVNTKMSFKDKANKKIIGVETEAEIDFMFSKSYKGKMNISWISDAERREFMFQTNKGLIKIDYSKSSMHQEYIKLLKDFRDKLKKRTYIERDGLESLKLVLECYRLANYQ